MKRGASFIAVLIIALNDVVASVPPHQATHHRGLEILKRPPWPPREEWCVEPNTFFDTTIIVTFDGVPNDLDSGIYRDLEDSFVDAYNELRQEVCDVDSRKVVNVDVNQDSLDIKGINEFSLLFNVRVGCDGCASDTTLFDVQPDTQTRQLEVYKRQYHVMIRGGGNEMSTPSAQPTPSPISGASPQDEDGPSEEGDDDCCPQGGERRAPYATEFVAVYDTTYKAIGIGIRRLQAPPIDQVLQAVEVLSFSCETELEDFETNVFVELGGDPVDAVDSEIVALEVSFQRSYNVFGEQEVCDPLFRVVTQVTAEIDDDEVNDGQQRDLQRRKRFNYRVRGRCRGCSRNPRLFAQGVSGRDRRQLEEDDQSNTRQLGFVFDDNCFCAVGAELRGVFEDEFIQEYDDNIQVLRSEGIVENVETVEDVQEEPVFTWSPTTSPTNFPTAPTDSPVPSPSPSRIPTGNPTEST